MIEFDSMPDEQLVHIIFVKQSIELTTNKAQLVPHSLYRAIPRVLKERNGDYENVSNETDPIGTSLFQSILSKENENMTGFRGL